MAATTRNWDRRGCQGRAIGLTALIVAVGCSPRPPDPVGQTNETRQSALISQTATFQDGVSGYAGTIDTRIVQNNSQLELRNLDHPHRRRRRSVGDGTGRRDADSLGCLRHSGRQHGAGGDARARDHGRQLAELSGLRARTDVDGDRRDLVGREPGQRLADVRRAVARTIAIRGAGFAGARRDRGVHADAERRGVAKVQQWVDDPTTNFGVIVFHATNSNKLSFSSSETSPVAANRPTLAVTYLLPRRSTAASRRTVRPTARAARMAGGDLDAAGGSGGTGGSGGSSDAVAADAAPAGASGSDAGTAGSGQGGASGNDAGGAGGTGGSPSGPSVLYAAGDIGDCASAGDTGTGRLLDGLVDPSAPIAVLGDIAYPNASLGDFTNCFDPSWGRHKARIRPVPGNHEYGHGRRAGLLHVLRRGGRRSRQGLLQLRPRRLARRRRSTATATSVSCAAGDAAGAVAASGSGRPPAGLHARLLAPPALELRQLTATTRT